jgi:hypothetical protein
MNFSIKQIWKMIDIIRMNEAVFIGNQLGLSYLSPYQKNLLKAYGIDVDSFEEVSDIDKSFYFGIMAEVLGENRSFNVKKKNFDKWFTAEHNKPLSAAKRASLDYVKQRAFFDLQGLGNKVVSNMTNNILTSSAAEKNRLRKKIKEKSIEAIEKNQSMAQLASDLRVITQDWGRDFSRISNYIMQEAYSYGRAQQILETYGEDAEVYKQTFPGVCTQCEANYGTPMDEPVVYKLSDLIANGNNIGRKEQLPVVGLAHPWARSILHVKPEDSKWDFETNRFVVTRNTQGVQRKSKAKITITK